jgi:hypothetical protein
MKTALISDGSEYNNHQFQRDFINGKDFYGYPAYPSTKIVLNFQNFNYGWCGSEQFPFIDIKFNL